MASLKLSLFLSMLVLHGILLISYPVHCNELEEKFLQGINNFRESLNLPNLTKNKNAACLADEIAEELDDHPCSSAYNFSTPPGTEPNFPRFNKLLNKCDINVNTTTDGAFLPVCVPKLDPNITLSNYTTNTEYVQYLNDSKYIGVGVGSEDDWMVLILSTNTSFGSFSGAAASLASKIGMGHYMVALFLGLLLVSV